MLKYYKPTPPKNLKHIALVTKEKYPIQKALCLHDILTDELFNLTGGKREAENEVEKDLKNKLLQLNHLLSLNDPKIKNTDFVRMIPNGFLKDNKIGRLYPKTFSVTQMSKVLRYFLFKDAYKDFDLKNAHPTILYEFATENGLEAPFLEELVKSRKSFTTTITSELGFSEEGEKEVKKKILASLNYWQGDLKTDSKTLYSLWKEVKHLRVDIAEYISSKMSNDDIESIKNSEKFVKSKPERLRVTYQSLFCQTRESELLISLYSHLLESLQVDQEKLHFLTVFDGALIYIDDYSKQQQLCDYVEGFNKTQKLHSFEVKPWKEPDHYLLNQTYFDFCFSVRNELKELKVKETVFLSQQFGMDEFAIPDQLCTKLINDDKERLTKIQALREKKRSAKDPVILTEIENQIKKIPSLSKPCPELGFEITQLSTAFQYDFRKRAYKAKEEGTLSEKIVIAKKQARSIKKEELSPFAEVCHSTQYEEFHPTM